MEFWNQFEGQLLDGQFKLSKYSGAEGASAIFLSELPGQDQFVVVKIIRSASLQAQRLTHSWKIAKDLQHPNLIRAYATATADLDGLRVLYAVLDSPDASLADVIQERCLSEEEGRELLAGCAEALNYLHQKGLIHTRVRPANIVAIDEATKLSTDFLSRSAEKEEGPAQLECYDAPEVEKAGYSPATDIWALGVTLFEALTRSVPTGHADARVGTLPGPFPEILRHCLDPKPANRWSARQILSYLQSGAKPKLTPVATSMPESSPPVAVASYSLSKPNLLIRSGLWVRNLVPLRYGVSAVLILLCLGWLARTSQRERLATGTAGAAGFTVPAPVPVGPAEKIAPGPASTSSGTAERARSIWRVIVYTYSSAQSAQTKVRDLNAKSPELNARVLSAGRDLSHMVVVGGDMSRVAASNLRQRLLAEGFPKDIYILNFSE
ncbi:MAG: serine/threonine protein kinase [Bryobacteraceae bacterium]